MQQHESSAVSQLQQLLSTPRESSNSQHSNVMANLQALRDAGDNFLFTRSIIELATTVASHEVELLFHCITGCRHVVLTKWNGYSQSFRRALRDYFFLLGTHSPNRTIRLAYWNASASFWKRSWVDDLQSQPHQVSTPPSPQEQSLIDLIIQQTQLPHFHTPNHLFQHIQTMLLGDSPVSAASFLVVLIGEFSGGKSYYNMPLEFHKRAHSAFELGVDPTQTNDCFLPLHQCLHMSITALSRLVPAFEDEEVGLAIVQLTTEVIGWEWGTEAWDSTGMSVGGRALVRPPAPWREVLLQPEFIKAIFHVHHSKQLTGNEQLLHALRQLLLLLTSLTGPIFQGNDERKQFGSLLLEGTVKMLQTPGIANRESSHSLLVDSLYMVSRLFVNYKLSLLVDSPHLPHLLEAVAQIGRQLLHDNLMELQHAAGDFDLMQEREWREEALALMVEGLVLLCGDPWLLYSGSEEFRQSARAALARTLGPLYVEFVACRTQMARLEEMYMTAHDTELDEVREEIFAVDLEEELSALASIGRLDLLASLGCLTNILNQLVPKVQSLWDGNIGVVTPQAAGLLEESRLVTMYVGHLLTDDNEGETPVIPDTIVAACQQSNGEIVTQAIVGAVQTLRHFAQYQVSKITQNPADPRLSPLLAKSFLWFFHRWAPAYILPVDYGATIQGSDSIIMAWTPPERVQEMVSFVVTLCLHYHCYWPQERQVQDKASLVLHDLAKRCQSMRLALVATPAFRELISFHCLTSGIRHSAPPTEFDSVVRTKAGSAYIHLDMLRGYQRLPYDIKSKIMTALLVGCSEHGDKTSKELLNDCLNSIQEAFSSLVHALS